MGLYFRFFDKTQSIQFILEILGNIVKHFIGGRFRDDGILLDDHSVFGFKLVDFKVKNIFRKPASDRIDLCHYFIVFVVIVNAKLSLYLNNRQTIGYFSPYFRDVIQFIDHFFDGIDNELFHIQRPGAGIDHDDGIIGKVKGGVF